jgi:hypothetical protein
MVAFITSLLILALLMAPIFPYAKRRKAGTPVTWGEAMVGSAYVFFILFWIYGVVPHQWLTWADAELQWSPSRIWLGPGVSSEMIVPLIHAHVPMGFRQAFPMNVHAEVLRDIIATLIYVVALGVNMYLWVWWQKRGQRADAVVTPRSAYGRPIVKRS